MNSFKLLTKGAKFKSHCKRSKPNEIDSDNNSGKTSEANIIIDIDDNDEMIAPMHSFDEINEEYLHCNLEKSDYKNPTPIQMQTIPLMLNNRQLIACAPTGSGKTLAFLLPILIKLNEPKCLGFRAIILAPTRELVKQIHRESLWISNGSGLRIHMIKNVNLAAKKFNSKSRLKYDILITTPKRLVYLLKRSTDSINVTNLEWLIVDEYDRLLKTTFIKQLSSIFSVCFERSSSLKLALFSATFDQRVHEWCKSNLSDIVTVKISEQNKVAETIEQKLVFVGNETGKLFAIKEIIANGCPVPILIFVSTVRKANFLKRELDNCISIDTIHSDRKQEIRDRIVRSFREGKIHALICTELMGRGIDFKAVNLVINYDLPSSSIAYIHHIGRTGRAGRAGKAITFYSLKDKNRLRAIVKVMHESTLADIPRHLGS